MMNFSEFIIEQNAIHKEFKTFKDILTSLKKGNKLYWANTNYVLSIEKDNKTIGVTSLANNHYAQLGDIKYDIERVFGEK